jgi:peroxiredoxin
MPKTHALALFVGPPRNSRARFPFAPYQHFWGTDNALGQPHVWAPTDLGRIVLARGIRLSGRLVDSADRPIAGQTIIAYPLKGRDRHSTTTEADGTFALGPLRPANYLIYGEGQTPYHDWDLDAAAHVQAIRVVQPARVYLKEEASPEPLVLRELPTVRVELRFVDSKGKPTRGSTTKLGGLLPNDPHPPGRAPIPANRKREGTTSALNVPEREDPWEPTAWHVQDQPDDEGRVVFYAPQGLKHAFVTILPEEEATAFKHRIDANGPILPVPPAHLDVVERDRQLTIIAYRAPTVLVSVKTEDGAVPEELSVMARYTIEAQGYISQFVRQPDGRFRSQSLMPDHEYAIRVRDRRDVYDPAPLQRISVPESVAAELSFLLRKRRKPPGAGQTAPPFAVTTIEGQSLSLASLHGKTVLLHFWRLPQGIGISDAATLLAIHERFASNKRFTMVGLCVSDRSEEATRVIQSAGLSWSQAVLRDGFYDPIAINYGALQPDATFLIGPDGKLIARGLQGTALEKAVAEELAGK